MELQVLRRPGSYSLQYVFIAYINLIVTIHMFHCQLKPLILIVYAACLVGCGCRRVQCDQIAGGVSCLVTSCSTTLMATQSIGFSFRMHLPWTLRRLHEDTWERDPGRVTTTATALVVREASRWSAHRQPRALPWCHVRRRGGRQAHYGNSLDLASRNKSNFVIQCYMMH